MKLLRIWLGILTGVLVLDAVLAATVFEHRSLWMVAGLSAVSCIAAWRSVLATPRVVPEPGWLLGPAMELTNPDRPMTVKHATIAKRFLNLGFLTIGAPGSGKTILSLAYLHSCKDHSPRSGWAYFEGKGDTDIYRKCVSMGSPPTYFFSSELPGSDSINLMSGDAHDVVDRLCKILIGVTTSTSFYTDVQRAVLTKVIPLLLGVGLPANLRDLYAVLTIEDAGNELVRRAQEAKLDPVTITLAQQWFDEPLQSRIAQVSGLLNRLFIFVSGPYADRLNCYQPDIDISRAVPAGDAIYFHLPLTAFARDVAIAMVETFGVEARKRQLGGTEQLESYPLSFDDWGAFFHDGFGPFSARCRSAAMPLSFSFQSRAQLQHVSSTYADELDDTIATKIIMRVHGAATGKYAVELLGDYDAEEVGVTDREWNDGTSLSLRKTMRIDRRQLRELQPGEAFVSTLQSRNGQECNPLWRVRVPLPAFGDWQSVPMPAAREHEEGEGLSCWSRYMNPLRLKAIHRQVIADAEQVAQQQRRDEAIKTRDERQRLAANPGFSLGLDGDECADDAAMSESA